MNHLGCDDCRVLNSLDTVSELIRPSHVWSSLGAIFAADDLDCLAAGVGQGEELESVAESGLPDHERGDGDIFAALIGNSEKNFDAVADGKITGQGCAQSAHAHALAPAAHPVSALADLNGNLDLHAWPFTDTACVRTIHA